jgi:nicotinic acid mononucleotide adenylyltransferase
MSDLAKLESATNKIQNLLEWAKQNTMLVGILITVIPAVMVFGYNAITQFNKWKDAAEDYDNVSAAAYSAERKVKLLEERLAAQQEAIMKLQDRSSDALLNAREAKTVAESTQKEVRSLARAQEVELKAVNDSMNAQLNAIKRATTNRLGN